MLIVYILLSLLFFFMSMWIAYVAGMSKGFQNLMNDDPNFKFGSLDAAVYSNLSGIKLKDINPVAEMLADQRVQDFKDRQKIEKRNAVQKKFSKKKKKSNDKK